MFSHQRLISRSKQWFLTSPYRSPRWNQNVNSQFSTRVSIYDHEIRVRSAAQIRNSITNSTFPSFPTLEDDQYFFYCILQSREYASASPSYPLFETAKQHIHQRILPSFTQSLNPISLRLLFDYEAINSISTLESSDSLRNLLLRAITADSTHSLLARASKASQNSCNIISSSELLPIVESAINSRVLSLSNQQFANLLEALVHILQSSGCNEFVHAVHENHLSTFAQIELKLKQYERTPELVMDDISCVPSILYQTALLSKYSQSMELSQETLGFFDRFLNDHFKHLSSEQLVHAAAAFLDFTQSQSEYAAVFHSRFLDTFYFTLLKSTPYYTKEYLTRKLGIPNMSFHDQPIGQLIRTALTRMYLMNVRSMHPPFEKFITFSFDQKCKLVQHLVNNSHFCDSPLIAVNLQDILSHIRSTYLNDIVHDTNVEAQHYNSIQQAAATLAPIYRRLSNRNSTTPCKYDRKLLEELRDLILTFFFRHSAKFMQSTQSMLNLIEVAACTNDHMTDLFAQLLRIRIKEFLTTVEANGLSAVQIINTQHEHFTTLIRLFDSHLQHDIDDCIPFFTRIIDSISLLSLSNTLTFIQAISNLMSRSESLKKLILTSFLNREFRQHFYQSYSCHIRLLIIFLNGINSSLASAEFGDAAATHSTPSSVNLLVNQEIEQLLANAKPDDINEGNIQLTIEFLALSDHIGRIASKEFDALESAFFRIIADQHSSFSLEGYESIIEKCLQLKNINKNFDDGSECYPISLLEELAQFNREKYAEFSPKFKEIIKPHLKQEDDNDETGESMLDKCFNTIKSTTLAFESSQQQSNDPASQSQNNHFK